MLDSGATPSPPGPAAANLAEASAGDLQDGRYAELAAKFNSLGAPSATASQICQNWETITARPGPRPDCIVQIDLIRDPEKLKQLRVVVLEH